MNAWKTEPTYHEAESSYCHAAQGLGEWGVSCFNVYCANVSNCGDPPTPLRSHEWHSLAAAMPSPCPGSKVCNQCLHMVHHALHTERKEQDQHWQRKSHRMDVVAGAGWGEGVG